MKMTKTPSKLLPNLTKIKRKTVNIKIQIFIETIIVYKYQWSKTYDTFRSVLFGKIEIITS